MKAMFNKGADSSRGDPSRSARTHRPGRIGGMLAALVVGAMVAGSSTVPAAVAAPSAGTTSTAPSQQPKAPPPRGDPATG